MLFHVKWVKHTLLGYWRRKQQLRRNTSGDRARVYVVSFHNDCKGASNTFTEFSV